MRQYKLLLDLPFLKKGRIFEFDDDTGDVYAIIDDETVDTPLRSGLAGYLWLLLTEKRYMKLIL